MRILFAGDAHNDANFVQRVCAYAWKFDFTKVVFLGDFGYYPNWPLGHGKSYLKYCARFASEANVELYWLAGNHEDWDAIDVLHRDVDGFVYHDGLIHIPSGHAWEWGGLRFGCLGGAYSVDKDFRDVGVDWFPQEMPNPECIPELGEVDILLTHDAPTVPPQRLATGRFFSIPEAAAGQAIVMDAVRSAKPKHLFHGHWHLYEHYYVDHDEGHCYCIGLDCNTHGMEKTVIGIDTDLKQMFTLQRLFAHAEGIPLNL